MRTVAAALIIGWATSGAALAGPAFDPVLDGLDRGCERTRAFAAWEDGLIGQFMPMADPSDTPGPPKGFERAVGKAEGYDKGSHIRVVVPVDGTFRGYRLKRLSFAFGKQNDLHAYAVEFAEPAATIAEAFDAAVAAGDRTLRRRGGSTALDLDGRVAILCNLAK